jgi:hypothetical protein
MQIAILVEALVLGYYVAVADYAGTQAAFCMNSSPLVPKLPLIFDAVSGLQAGYSTLDSVRAVQRSGNITGITTKPITTLHGYSSGAQAVGWACISVYTFIPKANIVTRPLNSTLRMPQSLILLAQHLVD